MQQEQAALQLQLLSANKNDTGEDQESFLLHLNQYIESHIKDGTITAEMICREMNMSETPLRTKIRELTSLSLNAYVMAFRMGKASKLIETTELPLAEVALECGYSSFSYFSQAFKRYFNTLPSQYARRPKTAEKVTI